ncbi:MAG: hypothetical protein ABSF26_30140 [Thermoguttaceae bacterium]|jgi:threonine synthase
MKRSLVSLLVAAAVVVGGVFVLPASALAEVKHTKTSNKSKVETYVVVKVGDDYKVLSTSSLAAEEKRIKEDNKKKQQEWEDTRRADPSIERPVPVKLKRIESGFKTQEGAQKYIEKLQEKEDAGDKAK